MGFFTNVNDLPRKNKLIEELLFGNGSIVTIIASGSKNDLEPLKAVYKDREYLENSIYKDNFDIKENFIENGNDTYNAVMSIVKKIKN